MSKPFPADVQGIERLARRLRGRKLPAERELSEQFRISRARVRAALDLLESRGLVARRQGSGTYALEDGSASLNNVALLVDARLKLGNDPFFSTVIERLQQVCQAEGIRCTLERVDGVTQPAIVEDGIIAVGLATRCVLEALRRQDVPAVGLFVHADRSPGARVTLLDLDDRAGGRCAAEHLLALGCRRIWFVGHGSVPASAKRLAGASSAARAGKAKLKAIDAGMNYAAGLASAMRIEVKEGASPVGVIAANDWLALGLHMGLTARGMHLRAAVAIVSFDGLPLTADADLRIRSLAVPIEAMACDALSELRRLSASPIACGRDITYAFE